MKILSKRIGYLLFFITIKGYGLVPIESAVMGKLNRDLQHDPLDFAFSSKNFDLKTDKDFRISLKKQVGFISEGENLKNKCVLNEKIEYKNYWKKKQAISSVVSTLQYIGLDITTRAIGKYAKTFDFSEEDYQNLVHRLVNNYCSKNMTVISHKMLKDNLLDRFKNPDSFNLPSTNSSPFFPESAKKWSESMSGREQEFEMTIKLFRSLCSWGGDHEDLRLMTMLLKNPFIMAYINRHLRAKDLEWDMFNDKIILVDSDHSVQVLCRDLICRKVEKLDFEREFPLSAGSSSLASDLERLYCQFFRDANYKISDIGPQIKKWIDKTTLEEEKFIPSQMISLLTNMPDLLLSSPSYKDFVEIAKGGISQTWTNWATKANEKNFQELFYEESLNIQLVDRSHYFYFMTPEFKVKLEVILGEIDKTFALNDKISFVYPIKLDKKFLKWVRLEYLNATNLELEEKVVAKFIEHISDQVNKIQTRLLIAPWQTGIERIVALEILEQLKLYQGNYFNGFDSDNISIPVEFRYGLFALKYMNYRAKNTNTL